MREYDEIINKLRTVGCSAETIAQVKKCKREHEAERHHHDRVQDFEVAEAEQLRQMTIERNMLAKKLKEKESALELMKQSRPHWHNAKTDPPEESDEYIVMIEGGVSATTLLYNGKSWFEERDGEIAYYKVTHWMPMPEEPWRG